GDAPAYHYQPATARRRALFSPAMTTADHPHIMPYPGRNLGEPIVEHAGDQRILFLFRHGETDWNREGRLQGHTDTLLNATGLAQAGVLAETLRPHRLDAVVSSDLARARTTVQIVAGALGVPVF